MARRRKQATAEMRDLRQNIASMETVDEEFDAGNGVTLAAAKTLLAKGDNEMKDFNKTIASADDKDNIFKDTNKEIRAFNKKILPAGGLKYGTDSSEYEVLGGTRDSERKKPVRKPKDKPVT